MGKNISISVLMPVYNEKEYIREAIDSILSQTYPDIELIIINDASDDGTDVIIHSYFDERLTYKDNLQRQGNYISRNLAARFAKGKYLAMMDADDIAMPDRLAKQYKYLEAHPEVLAVGSDRVFIPTNSYGKFPHSSSDILLALLIDNAFVHSSLMVRTEIFCKLRGYDVQYYYSADYDLACRLALEGKVENLPEALVKYRWHPNQISQKYQKDQAYYATEIRQKYQIDFINSFRQQNQTIATKADVTFPNMGRVIAYYTFAKYSGKAKYEQMADDLLDTILSSLSLNISLKLMDSLLGIAIGLVYLLRNGFVSGEEDEVFAEIDFLLFKNLSLLAENKMVNWYSWFYYFRLRIFFKHQPKQQLYNLVLQQNFSCMLDLLICEIQKSWILDKETLSEIKWFHQQKLCPEKTAIVLEMNI